ncbi:MAG: PD-(D/E)XK nuclease family protein [Lachnospiraceae bacterium]|nr:PD-(D/E)XK nuclease family protein [Lachnospiraceae bacterium]
MALRIYKGCSGSGKSYRLYKHIIDESLAHPELTYLVIVPEQYNLSTQRTLISMHPKKGMLNIDVLSFTRLAHRVFEEVGYFRARGVTIDDIGKNLILRHLASENEGELTALAGMFNKLGYISEVKSVISEFMQYGIGDAELEKMIGLSESRGILKGKLNDIRLLYGKFLEFIKEKYITTEEILEKVRDAVPDSKKLKNSVLAFDGYTGFTPVQLNLIDALLKNCVDVYMTVLADEGSVSGQAGGSEAAQGNAAADAAPEDLFYLSHKTLASLDKICRKGGIGRKEDVVIRDEVPARFMYFDDGRVIPAAERKDDLIFLEKSLFKKEHDSYDKCENIKIFTGTDPFEEALEAAVRIERLVREEGYHYRDIAVVSGDIGTYMNACARAFARYDIPFFVDKTIPVLLNPMVEYIRALFEIITGDYSYEAMFKYLRSGLFEAPSDKLDRLDNYVLRYGIKGRKRWNEPFIIKPKEMSDEDLTELNELRQQAVDSINVFYDSLKVPDTSAGEAKVKEISAALYGFMKKNRLAEKMHALSVSLKEKGEAVKAKEYGRIYEEVCILLDKMVSLLPGETITLKEYCQLLDAGFAEIRTGVLPYGDDYVQVGDLLRTRLGNIKALFFMGVNDGIVPSKQSGGGIISDIDREFLTDNVEGIEMAPTVRMQSYTQRLYLYMLVTRPKEKLFVSYAKLSQDGDSLNPSYFVGTMTRMFPGLKVSEPGDNILNRVYGLKSGYDMLASSLQDYIRIGEDKQPGFDDLFEICTDNEEYRHKVRMLLDEAFRAGDFNKKDVISKAVARALYGNDITCSVTRLEKYAQCAYSHFLRYGLSIKERELFSFEAGEMGSVFHDTLQAYATILKERGLTWTGISEEESDKLIEESITRCIAKEDYSAIYGSFRTGYALNRMRRITKRTVDTLTKQLKKGRFIPREFEFSFSSCDDCESLNISLSEEEKLHLIGRIDRIDSYEDEKAVYVKVIDYKSGNKGFDLAAVYLGLDLQLVVYLNAVTEMVSREVKDEKNVIPAGILYYHIDDPVIADDSEETPGAEEIDAAILSELRMKGLVNSEPDVYRLMDGDFVKRSDVIPVTLKKDGTPAVGSSVASTEDFKILSDYVNYKIRAMGRDILDGDISIEPHINASKKSACEYCEYKGICGYRGDAKLMQVPDEDEDGEKLSIIDVMKRDIAK